MLTRARNIEFDQLLALAHEAKRKFPLLDVWLAQAIKGASTQETERILSLLDKIAEHNRILPLLIPTLRMKQERIRSKAALVFSRLCRNTIFATNSLKDLDPRVRANAIEGLWGVNFDKVKWTLLAATRETDNRTMANAALGLYRLGERRGLLVLEGMTDHPNAKYRASAAWAMGETRDPACLPALDELRDDPDPTVKKNVVQAVEKINSRGD